MLLYSAIACLNSFHLVLFIIGCLISILIGFVQIIGGDEKELVFSGIRRHSYGKLSLLSGFLNDSTLCDCDAMTTG